MHKEPVTFIASGFGQDAHAPLEVQEVHVGWQKAQVLSPPAAQE